MSQTSEATAFLARIARLPPESGAFEALTAALEPSLEDEAALRRLFATDKANTRLRDPHVGLVDVFDAPPDIRVTRARVVKDDVDLSANFVLPLSTDRRRKEGAPSMVPNLDEFKKNWAIFTEGSLSQLIDWNNVVAAGGSVQACLSPLPESAKASKRALRKHFHNNIYPTSDVDLFLYGLTPEQAEAKITSIYEAVRDSIPWDVTCIRTKHTVSIHSQYPYRAVQIVLRLYRSPAEILAGFDVDAPCCAYDGQRVWANPRAIVAMMRQCNTADMTRRSPSYEVRLAKYASRRFEVYIPSLKRDDIDPTIFERSISRIQGLARLLVLERLVDPDTRTSYLNSRRNLRGRPQNPNGDAIRYKHKKYKGDLKADADFCGLEMNDYDVVSLHIPYGPGWDARRIERLVYQTDLGMNSPFNPKNKDRRLHRHPAYFGTMQECLEDCCEFCPEPKDEEKELQEVEDAMYIRGRVSFMQEDPGRQSISGSFNPIDVGEWEEQAYIGPIEKLFNAIAARDRALVSSLIRQEDADLARRDCVGRSPLHMAILSGASAIACDLIDAGARMTARLVDGRTSLHLAAQLNMPDVVRKVLDRSAVNEEQAKAAEEEARKQKEASGRENSMDIDDEEDTDMEDDNSSEDDWDADDKDTANTAPNDQIPEDEDEPDIIDVNAPDWDIAFTPLHYAVYAGALAVVEQLLAAGADAKCATKAPGWDTHPLHPLTVTAITYDEINTGKIAEKLFTADAVSSEADEDLSTIFHKIVCAGKPELVHTFLRSDPNVKAVLGIPHIKSWSPAVFPLVTALAMQKYSVLAILLAHGAKAVFTEQDYTRALDVQSSNHRLRGNGKDYLSQVAMPIETAIALRDDVVSLLVGIGAEFNLPTRFAAMNRTNIYKRQTSVALIDWLRGAIEAGEQDLKRLEEKKSPNSGPDNGLQKTAALTGWKADVVKIMLTEPQRVHNAITDGEEKRKLREDLEFLRDVESILSFHGAKTWNELYPDDKVDFYPKDHFSVGASPAPTNVYTPVFKRLTGPLNWNQAQVPKHQVPLYEQLYDACFNGDNTTIEKLCLPKTGQKNAENLLQIASTCGHEYGLPICTPLSVAISAKHWDTARLILSIAIAQYEPEPAKIGTYDIVIRLDEDDEEDSNGEDDEYDENHDMATVEPINFVDLAKRPSSVKTVVSPKTFLEQHIQWLKDDGESCNSGTALTRAVSQKDFEAFVQTTELYNILPESPGVPEDTIYSILQHDDLTVPAMLDELIRRTGCGIPAKDETEDEDDDIPVEHKHASGSKRVYLGLNVHGKKRKDLATQGDPNALQNLSQPVPLLWIAVENGVLNAIEYFASGTPLIAYQHYAATHSDERAMRLRRTPNLAETLPQWLGWTTNVLGESAVTTALIADRLECLERMAALRPSYVRQVLDVRLRPSDYNHMLVAANWGASEATFDYLLQNGISSIEVENRGWNMFHFLANGKENHTQTLEKLLRRLPDDIVTCLMIQQSKDAQNTPLHLAVKLRNVSIVRMFMSHKAAPFLARDAEGSTPLHTAVRKGCVTIAKLLAEAGPTEALYVEDGVGNTPLEIAYQRELLRRTRKGFLGHVNVNQLGQTRDCSTSGTSFNTGREVEIIALRTTVDKLLQDGRLRQGTKLGTELLKFTERMEAKLESAKEEQACTAHEAVEATPEESFQVERDGDDAASTLFVIEQAIAARPLAQNRLPVHVLDVHKSVNSTLDQVRGLKQEAVKQAKVRSAYRRFGKKKDEAVLEDEDEDEDESKLMEQSVLKRWAGDTNPFGRDYY